jgi:acetoin utilization protein AcuB
MLIKNWMTTNVVTINADEPVMRVVALLKQHNVRRLPVEDKSGHLAGIVTDRDFREAAPSKATSLDHFEIKDQLDKMTVADIMTPQPLTVRPEDTIIFAAAIMRQSKVSGMPVINDENVLVGIITESDLFKALIEFSGVGSQGMLLAVANHTSETTRTIIDIVEAAGGLIQTLLTYTPSGGERELYLRLTAPDEATYNKVVASLGDHILYRVTETEADMEERLRRRHI